MRAGLTPSVYARKLLDSLGFYDTYPAVTDNRSASLLWAQSGAMWLTGHAGEDPRHCVAPLAACARGAWLALSALAPGKIDDQFDAHCLLGERAALMALERRGRLSAGGSCQLYDAADGIIALNLARDSDYELLPAWLGMPDVRIDQLHTAIYEYSVGELVERGRMLGMAVAPVRHPDKSENTEEILYRVVRCGKTAQARSTQPLVIDLSSLWAGPLCAQLLGNSGARVIKIESLSRPDGARSGNKAFFDLLNAGKESVVLDLCSVSGIGQLRVLLEKADIVVESSRPRALEQMGINAEEIVAKRPGMVWVGITGYGRDRPMRDWVAYGDDAGVAAGLSWLVGGARDPVFCGDAIADPLTGLHAALLALAKWQSGGGELLDIALRNVVAYCIRAGVAEKDAGISNERIARPEARNSYATAVEPGSDTDRVLNELA